MKTCLQLLCSPELYPGSLHITMKEQQADTNKMIETDRRQRQIKKKKSNLRELNIVSCDASLAGPDMPDDIFLPLHVYSSFSA